MALINCPECHHQVSDAANQCPKCGYPISDLNKKSFNNEAKANTNESKGTIHTEANKKKANGCLLIIFLFIIIILLISIFSKGSDDNKDDSKGGKLDVIELTKEDSIQIAKSDSIAQINRQIEEEEFLKTKAGKIYKKHPEWSKDDCIKIANGKIWIGMHYDMLVYQMGKPNTINTSNYGRGNEYQACWDDYDPGCFYFNESYIVSAYN